MHGVGNKNFDGACRLVITKEFFMTINPITTPGFLARIIRNDSTRKGVAAAAAGVVIAAVSEVLWPSS